jgi:hypothetical protein
VKTKNWKKDYKEYWKPLFGFFGLLNFNQVKKELSDYLIVIENVPHVYMEITGGTLSYITYESKTVIQEYEKYIERDYIEKAFVEELLEYDDINELKDYLKELLR